MNSKATPVTAPAILDAAAGHMRDRAATYDKPEGERSMAQTVDIFNRYHGTNLTEAQGWHFMQVLKDVRLFTRPGYHADSGEDGVAYAGLKCEAKAKEKTEPSKVAVLDPEWIEFKYEGRTPMEYGWLVYRSFIDVKYANGNATFGCFAGSVDWSSVSFFREAFRG